MVRQGQTQFTVGDQFYALSRYHVVKGNSIGLQYLKSTQDEALLIEQTCDRFIILAEGK